MPQRLLPRISLAFLRCRTRGFSAAILLVGVAELFLARPASFAAEDVASSEARLQQSAAYLASDELEGRGIGTKGIDAAADYIAQQFASLGLKTDLFDGGPFQKFKMTVGAELGANNQLTLVGPPTAEAPDGQKIALNLEQEFRPLSTSGSGTIDLPLVFVGYGITAADEMYDDYAGIDVTGKAVVILRKEPQQSNPHSVFNGTDASAHAPFLRKLSNAYEHGAAAVILVNDEYGIRQNVAAQRVALQEALDKLAAESVALKELADPTLAQIEEQRAKIDELAAQVRTIGDALRNEYDPLLGFNAIGDDAGGRNFAIVSVRRAALDAALRAATGLDLSSLETQIDAGPAPHSMEISGWKLAGEVAVNRTEVEVKNVIGVLEGEGPLADETVVVGAHYDHLGFGGFGSFVPDEKVVHNGADDNGSGTATLLEVARQLATTGAKFPRRIVFMAFTAEERGLIGSAHYVEHPLFPHENVVAMLNMDMVGRLNENKLIIQGVDTSPQFGPLVDEFNERYGFAITRQMGGFGPSDHSSFYGKQIPVMHFYTGTHADYHRPSDDADKLNVPGMRQIGEMVAGVAGRIAQAEARPEFVNVAAQAQPGGGGDRPYFGSIPDFAQDKPGYALMGVTQDGPAAKAGLQAGDIIIKLGESNIGNLEDFDSALRKHKAGEVVPVVVQRGEQELTFDVTLDPPR